MKVEIRRRDLPSDIEFILKVNEQTSSPDSSGFFDGDIIKDSPPTVYHFNGVMNEYIGGFSDIERLYRSNKVNRTIECIDNKIIEVRRRERWLERGDQVITYQQAPEGTINIEYINRQLSQQVLENKWWREERIPDWLAESRIPIKKLNRCFIIDFHFVDKTSLFIMPFSEVFSLAKYKLTRLLGKNKQKYPPRDMHCRNLLVESELETPLVIPGLKLVSYSLISGNYKDAGYSGKREYEKILVSLRLDERDTPSHIWRISAFKS